MERRSVEETRQRGWSVATDGTVESSAALDDDIKRQLLDSMPSGTNDDHDEDPPSEKPPAAAVTARTKRDSSDMSMEDDDSTPSSAAAAASNNNNNNESSRNNSNDPERKRARTIQQTAQGRLSKWAARLFDPDRPRGLVEPPQVIPLNDEFLQAFGKREKALDEAKGVAMTIDREIAESDDDDDDDDNLFGDTPTLDDKGAANNDKGFKVKITNLNYTTRQTDLMKVCSAFGAVTKLNLEMEGETLQDNAPRNTGRAFVYFDKESEAKACVEGLTELDGRPLRVDLKGSASGVTGSRGRPSLGTTGSSRYYARDISTKCFRCGEVGHRESDCKNPARAKPCPVCAGIDHDLRTCPIKAVCFNCGIPGHVARSCNMPRGTPPLAICTVCFQRGHNKMNCRQSYRDASAVSSKAICMVCGEEGHYLCQQLEWFFSMQGVSCGNCGQSGHIGEECRRPNIDQLSRDDELARKEVEMVMEEEERMGRQRQRDQHPGKQRRAKSAAPRMGRSSSSSNNNDGNQQRVHSNGSQYRPREPRGWG